MGPSFSLVLLACLALPAAAIDRFADVEITPFVHSSVQLEHAGKVIQVDPWSVGDLSRAKPADLILITDDPGHHLDVKAIARLRKPGAPVVIPANGRAKVPDGIVMSNGESRDVAGVRVEAIAAAASMRSRGTFIGKNATAMFFTARTSGTHSVTPAK